MLIGANLPEGHPTRVAAITRHVNDSLSPNPGRQMRGQVNLTKMGLSPSEHFAFNLPNAPAKQAVPVDNHAAGLLPQPISTGGQPGVSERDINHAVNQFVKQFNFGNMKVDRRFSMPNAATTAQASHIASLANQYIGTPYVYGGESPRGFDCSGFAQFLYGKVGVSIPRTTYTQWTAPNGRSVQKGQLQPGDLVFFRGSDSKGGLPGHVGVYVGGGMMIDSPHTGSHVRLESVSGFGGYMGARRYHR